MVFSNMTVKEAVKHATNEELREFIEQRSDFFDSQEARHAKSGKHAREIFSARGE